MAGGRVLQQLDALEQQAPSLQQIGVHLAASVGTAASNPGEDIVRGRPRGVATGSAVAVGQRNRGPPLCPGTPRALLQQHPVTHLYASGTAGGIFRREQLRERGAVLARADREKKGDGLNVAMAQPVVDDGL